MNNLYNLINEWCGKHKDIHTCIMDIPSKIDGANYTYPAVIVEYPFRYTFSVDSAGLVYSLNIMFQANVNDFSSTSRSHQPYFEQNDPHIIAQDYLRSLFLQLLAVLDDPTLIGYDDTITYGISNISCMGYTEHNDDSIECLRVSFNVHSNEVLSMCLDEDDYQAVGVLDSPLGSLIPKSFD